MGAFFRELIGRTLGKLVTMGLFLGGGYYYANQNGHLDALNNLSALTGPVQAGLPTSLSLPTGQTPRETFDMQARVSSVGVDCRLFDFKSARATRTEAMPCDRAEDLLATPDFSDHELREFRSVQYIYFAPDGQQVLRGAFKPDVDAMDRYSVGMVIDISVDRKDPNKSQPI